MMCHASLCYQVLFLRVNEMASGIFSHLFHVCLTQVSLLKEGILYPSETAFKGNSTKGEEHVRVESIGCSKKVA